MRFDSFESVDAEWLPTDLTRLPLYAEPLPDEALLSWAWRLATRFGWNPTRLARNGIGVRVPLEIDWWARPDGTLLDTIAARTGLELARLRQMTLLDWAPAVRDDEAGSRFAGWRFEALPPEERGRGLAVCRECLQHDAVPYVRRPWMVGWSGVCEAHGTVLLTRCPGCQRSLRTPRPGASASFQPGRCARCSADIIEGDSRTAPASVRRLHALLLRGKRTGVAELPRIGPLGWPDVVTLCDVLIGAVWEEMGVPERLELFNDATAWERLDGSGRVDFSGDRLGGLLLLAWLLDDWPMNLDSSHVGGIVRRWVREERRRMPTRIGPSFEELRASRIPDLLTVAERRQKTTSE